MNMADKQAPQRIPLSRPFLIGKESEYVLQALQSLRLSGDGRFTAECHRFLEKTFACKKALLTPSCTAALEMAALLCDIEPGDEVILPSYTFVSTVNAFCLRGAKPVFIDIRPDTLCMDERAFAAAVTEKTKAVVPVHYAGVACDMESIMATAARHGILVVEDAAQALNASYHGRHLGTIGHMGTFSFHETKNLTCGEGGALLLNEAGFVARAEIIREKGTDRSRFLRGEAQKYTWQDIGSSFLPSELQAAVLLAQLEGLKIISDRRRELFEYYQECFSDLREEGLVKLPSEEHSLNSNHHLYYLLLRDEAERIRMHAHLDERGIASSFHFLPLHLSPMGLKYGYREGDLPVTESVASRLLRLPAHNAMTLADQDRVVSAVKEFYARQSKPQAAGADALAAHRLEKALGAEKI
jgi:dTDP-4-amino-4,6-dideoxygalactose transaminase